MSGVATAVALAGERAGGWVPVPASVIALVGGPPAGAARAGGGPPAPAPRWVLPTVRARRSIHQSPAAWAARRGPPARTGSPRPPIRPDAQASHDATA
jgi:hypothetical protein